MTFDEYLIQKKISPDQFQQAEPARYSEWQREFTEMHPESFTTQKKFLLNDTRRKYLVRWKCSVRPEGRVEFYVLHPTFFYMSLTLGELRGINDAVLNALKGQGISDGDSLLEAAKTPADRKALSSASGVDATAILELANRADLARIKGIGRVYSDLMEEAGVDTVKELAQRVPQNLHAKLIQINSVRQFTQRPPSVEQIGDFVEQAKNLPRMLEY